MARILTLVLCSSVEKWSLSFTLGKGVAGTGFPKNLHKGSHPAGDPTRSDSASQPKRVDSEIKPMVLEIGLNQEQRCFAELV